MIQELFLEFRKLELDNLKLQLKGVDKTSKGHFYVKLYSSHHSLPFNDFATSIYTLSAFINSFEKDNPESKLNSADKLYGFIDSLCKNNVFSWSGGCFDTEEDIFRYDYP